MAKRISDQFQVHNDSSHLVLAQVNLPIVAGGKIYVYENNPIPPTDSDKVFGYDPVEFVRLDEDVRKVIEARFIQEQTERYNRARLDLVGTYESYYENVMENMTVEMEGDVDVIIGPELGIAKDENGTLANEIYEEIKKGKSAEVAVHTVYQDKIDFLKSNEFTERIAEQIEQQRTVLQHHLHPDISYSSLRDAPEGSIIFCKNLPPAEVMSFVNKETGTPRFAGLVCTEASLKGHAAIIAKSLGVPFALVDPKSLPTINSGVECIIDGMSGPGSIVLDPSEALKREIRMQHFGLVQDEDLLKKRSQSDEPIRTLNGEDVSIFANFGASLEAIPFREAHVEGIGLYRSEMAENMRSDSAPSISENHWIKIFRNNLKECSPDGEQFVSACIRTLDISGDKAGKFSKKTPEEKAQYEAKVTRTQMGALLRLNQEMEESGQGGKLKVMIPMIASIDQMEAMQAQMDELAAERGVPTIKLGCMGEVPALFDKLDRLNVAFMSIGSNDLIHGLLETDRYHASSSMNYDPTDPSVLKALEKAVQFGKDKDVPISICGDMASEPRYLALAIGAGIRTLSAGINRAPVAKEVVRRIDTREAEALFELIKETSSRTERERILDHFNASRLSLWPEGRVGMDWNEFARHPFAPEKLGSLQSEPQSDLGVELE